MVVPDFAVAARSRARRRQRPTIFRAALSWYLLFVVIAAVLYFYLLQTVILELDDPNNAHSIYIIAQGNLPGRLGNKLFQFASTLGAYEHHKRQQAHSNQTLFFCVDPAFTQLERIFTGPFGPSCQFPDKKRRRIQSLPEQGYGKYNLQQFDTTCYYKSACYFTLGKYMQSWRYLALAENHIRERFRFRPAIQEQADQHIFRSTSNSNTTTLVAIHVRRGDVAGAADWLQEAPESYFEKSIKHMQDKYGGSVRFILASDDKGWCRQQPVFQRKDITILPKTTSLAVDLATLASCDHAILSVGTFGWWAAWLQSKSTSNGNSEHTVIYYKNALIMENWKNRNQVSLDDYYPPEWIGMS